VRVIDIPADAGAGLGLFEDLHGFPSADAFARHLKTASAEHYGTAARAFLEEVTRDPERVITAVATHRDAFVAEHCPIDADGQVKRVATRFGLVAANGEIAVAAGVLPWPVGEATRGVRRCFLDWLAVRGGTESGEELAGIAQVQGFIEAHGSSRFEAVWEGSSNDVRVPYRAGFRKRVTDGDESGWHYFILPEVWKNEVCRGYDPKALAKAMIGRGLLTPDPDGRHHAKLERVPGYRKMRVYHIPAAILDGDKHD
jgi:uncharacterized protein (DUF927 family)